MSFTLWIGSKTSTFDTFAGSVVVSNSFVVTPMIDSDRLSARWNVAKGSHIRFSVCFHTMLLLKNGKDAIFFSLRKFSIPKSNSWLPTVMADTPMTFKHSTSGRPLKMEDMGVPWRISPAMTTKVFIPLLLFLYRILLTRVDIRAIPPTSILPLSVLTLKGSRCPCRSLKKRRVTLTGALSAAWIWSPTKVSSIPMTVYKRNIFTKRFNFTYILKEVYYAHLEKTETPLMKT